MTIARRNGGQRWSGPLAAAVLLVLFQASARADNAPRFFRIGTAATTGTYFQIGAEIANAISKPPGSRDCARGGNCGVEGLVAVAQATQGSIDNAVLVGAGQLEGAFIQSDIAYWAYSGKLPAIKTCVGAALPESGLSLLKKRGAIANLRVVAALYMEAIHIVAGPDPKLKSVGDLKGKRVALGEPLSGTLADTRLVLDAAGVGECKVKAQYIGLSESASLIGKGGLDAFFTSAGYPVPAITDVASVVRLHLLPINGKIRDKLLQDLPFLSAATIPGATYPGIDTETPTLGVPALFVVSSSVPDDLAYGITKALWQDSTRRMLDAGHPAGKRITLENALKGIAIPLHPGAGKFYQEKGMKLPE